MSHLILKLRPLPVQALRAVFRRPLSLLGAALWAGGVAALLGGAGLAGQALAQGAGGAKEEYIIEHTLKLTPGEVFDVALSPDDRYMATLGANHALRLWEAEGGRMVKELRDASHQAQRILFHPKGGRLFTGGKDGAVLEWDIGKGQPEARYLGHATPVVSLASSADGKLLAAGGEDGRVLVWETRTQKKVAEVAPNNKRVGALAFHPDGIHLAYGGAGRDIQIFNIEKNKVEVRLAGHTGAITQLAFHYRPSLLASASADGTIKLWNWQSDKDPNTATLAGHKRAVTGLAFHPNEQWLISGSQDETIKIWNIAGQTVVGQLTVVDGKVEVMRLAQSGKRVMAAYPKDKARTWKLDKSAFLASLTGHTQAAVGLAFAPSGDYLASVSQDKTLKMWDWRKRKVSASYPTGSHVAQVVVYAPDEKSLYTGGTDGVVKAWNMADGRQVMDMRGHNGKVNALAYHPKDKVLLSGGSDKTWVLWNTTSGTPLKRVAGHTDQVMAAVFSPKGDLFATGSDNGQIRLWRYPSGALVKSLEGHRGGVLALAFHPDGGRLASGSRDGSIRIWEVATGQTAAELTGHEYMVNGLVYSVDGRSLISISKDKTVKLWDAQGGRFIRTISGEPYQLEALAISPDGKVIATGSIGTEIKLMVYPLKVEPAKPKPTGEAAGAKATEGGAATAGGGQEDEAGDEIDQASLAEREGEEDDPSLAYSFKKGDDPREVMLLEKQLNRLLKERSFCQNAQALESTALAVLHKAPYDKAAYHALLNVAITRKDLKMIHLMSKVGRRALFISGVYDYLPASDVEARLAFWGEDIFDASQERAGRELILDFEDCEGGVSRVAIPRELLSMEIPQEVLQLLATKKLELDFAQFQQVDTETFLARFFSMNSQAVKGGRKREQDKKILLKNTLSVPTGEALLDLSLVDIFGEAGRVVFKLRRAKGPWMSYRTDPDRKKRLLLQEGYYYLAINNKVRQTFRVGSGGLVDVAVPKTLN